MLTLKERQNLAGGIDDFLKTFFKDKKTEKLYFELKISDEKIGYETTIKPNWIYNNERKFR